MEQADQDGKEIPDAAAKDHDPSSTRPPEKSSGSFKNASSIPLVPWRHQFMALVRWKTIPVLSRKPLSMMALLLSSVVSVILSWLAGPDIDNAAPTGACNAPDIDFFKVKPTLETYQYVYSDGSQENYTSYEGGFDYDNYDVRSTINDNWQGGVPVLLISFGPLIAAMTVYFIVHDEIQLSLFGMIRGLGVHDSAYWMSWFIPFAIVAMVNSLLGAITAKMLPVHVYQSVYFGGIFASLWFLQLSLIAASLFAAAVSGKGKRIVVLWVIVLLLGPLIPWGITWFATFNESPIYMLTSAPQDEVKGIFWYYQQTNRHDYNYDAFYYGTEVSVNETWKDDFFYECTIPLMSDQEFNNFKTKEERQNVPDENYFTGCFAQTGMPALLWNLEGPAKLATAFLYFLPYFHLHSLFGNFLGYTADQKHTFTIREASLSTANLVTGNREFDAPSNDALFPNGALLALKDVYWFDGFPCEVFNEEGSYCETYKDNCAHIEGFCDNHSWCSRGRAIDAPSVNLLFVHLLILTFFYLSMAWYWGIAFVSGNKPYFPFLWSYWASSPKPVDTESSESVEVTSVVKSFGSVQAVKQISLCLLKGEITALLGHNGAGKTTLSNMIICETLPSKGDISVFGRSVKEDSFNVRRLVGVCKQDDYLWPSLTAREHLFLFARLNGVDNASTGHLVQKWLESVDLDLVQNQFSRQFSGGMKRRLSLALSTIGGRPLIVLDEPTTGMDPVSRRFVWKHIDLVKENRVVLLTTHSMEEADLLSDQVAIMKEGTIAALGTSLQLKSEYGSALQFNILAETSSILPAVESIENMFSAAIDFVNIKSHSSGNITLNVVAVKQAGSSDDGVDVDTLTNFITWLEDGSDHGILEYGFSNSSLEEVFLKVTNSEGPVEQNCAMESTEAEQAPPLSGDNPVDEEAAIESSKTRPTPLSPGVKSGDIGLFQQVNALMVHHCSRAWTGRRSIGCWISIGLLTALVAVAGTGMAGVSLSMYGGVVPCLAASLKMLVIAFPIFSDRSEGLFYLMRSQGLLSGSYIFSYFVYATLVGVGCSLLLVSVYYATNVFRHPEVCRPNYDQYCGTWLWRFGDRPLISEWDLFKIPIEVDSNLTGTQNFSVYAHRAPSGYGPVFLAALVFGLSFPGTVLTLSVLPGNKIAMLIATVLLLGSSMTPLLHQFLSFSERYGPQYEQELEECLSLIAPTVDCGELSVSSLDEITVDAVNCIGAMAQANPAVAFSLCQHASVGLLPHYGLFQTLFASLSWRITFGSEQALVVELLSARLDQLGLKCHGATCDFPFAQKLFWRLIGYEILGLVILILLGVFVSTTISFPNETVLRFKRMVSMAIFANKSTQTTGSSSTSELPEVVEEREFVRAETDEFVEKIGADNIKVNLEKVPRNEVSPVIMQGLRKVYPAVGNVPPKVALESLDLHVPNGEVIGLLGKNGAGKTTALKILAGAHDATSGIGLVAGYDVGLERLAVFARMGNCAQFDVIWPRLTVKEHLVFFTRLKGCPWKDSAETAKNIAVAVGLGSDEVYNRRAGNLSGGMRRRLSIAISLVSSPKVLILDEPTTGLDPATRSTIWELITSLSTPERAMVLTTHQMIEADTLCNRIAIMAKGKLVVVGTQQYLKDKFGSGYILQLNLVHSTQENVDTALSFCREHLHEEAAKSSKQAKTLHVHLPPDLDLKAAFSALYNPNIRPQCVNQFLLNQSSLEDVFLALGDGYELEEECKLEI